MYNIINKSKKEVNTIEQHYNPKARICAFIYAENKLYLGKTHTECIMNLLIEKRMIKNEKQFFKMLNSDNEKYINQIQNWSFEIEKCSIFGELSFFNNNLTAFVFDFVTNYGLQSLKNILHNKYGPINIYQAKYDINYVNNYSLIKLI